MQINHAFLWTLGLAASLSIFNAFLVFWNIFKRSEVRKLYFLHFVLKSQIFSDDFDVFMFVLLLLVIEIFAFDDQLRRP